MVFVWEDGDLNEEQVDAIEHDGSVYLAACPGSGKTRALTYKIALELSKLESERHWVIAITYTHRAAEEISERIERLGVATDRLWIGTIHSFCLDWILRPYAIYHEKLQNGFRVVDQHETESILDELCHQSPHQVRALDCRYYYTTAGCQLENANPNRHSAALSVLDKYWQRLEENLLIDFEMILGCAYDLVVGQPSISKLLGSLFRYILVDQYQDTKGIQYAIIATILNASGGNTSTFIVGDPNQAIYGSLGGYAMTRVDFAALVQASRSRRRTWRETTDRQSALSSISQPIVSCRPTSTPGPLSFSQRPMRVLGAIVQALMRSMLDSRHDLASCRSIGAKLVRDDALRHGQ